jgi:hypothetical protein
MARTPQKEVDRNYEAFQELLPLIQTTHLGFFTYAVPVH